MSNSEKVTIVLKSIQCKGTSDGKNLNDELYIKYTTDGDKETRFPANGSFSIDSKDDNMWNIDLPMTYSNDVVVSLFDSETGKDQFLGSTTYFVADASKTESREIQNSNGADYILNTTPEA